jgi:hypothetical protein
MDDLKEKRRYWKLEKDLLDRAIGRICFGKGCGPVIIQTTDGAVCDN